jgi:sulfur-oxidizing protein SoxY
MTAHVASFSNRCFLDTLAGLRRAFFMLAAALMFVPAADASQSWPGIQAEVYAGKTLHDGRGVITLKAPYRPDDVRSVPLEADAKFVDGRTISTVTFIVDENPSPVAAAFRMAGSRPSVHLLTHIRLDQQSDVRVVVEASDGTLYMVEQLVKFAGGQASCSAPPTGDPAEILANTGKMNLAQVGEKAKSSHTLQRARLTLSHPNHTGMVLDQITLLYVPMLMVNHLEARQGDEVVFDMTGSITLAQNPVVEFDYITNGADEITTIAKDTSGAAWEKRFPIGPAS